MNRGLPVHAVIGELRDALAEHGVAVLLAPPGTGKTTGVPLALLDEAWMRRADDTPPRILVVEPRRLAARSAARRMASELGERPGETVGWSVRGERRVSERTRIEMVTAGLLLRRLQADPELDGVAAVLLDEFHERSIDDDLLLALLLDVRASLRPDLRLVVMSATLDPRPIARLLTGSAHGSGSVSPDDPEQIVPAPVVTATAPIHPIETIHRPRPGREPLEEHVATVVVEALAAGGAAAGGGDSSHPGDVLVFLPGRAEIRRCVRALAARGVSIGGRVGVGNGGGTVVLELHGGLSSEDQDAVLCSDPSGPRRVVLATSIAETSITVPGVLTVVDSGRRRTIRVHPETGLPGLVTEAVSMAGADQRRGRAGRLGPGRCYRLWSVEEERHRPAHDRPEVLDGDLAPLLLQVSAWGASVDDLAFVDPPSPDHLAAAAVLLDDLGAFVSAAPRGSPTSSGPVSGRLTDRGRKLAELGFHPRLGAVVLAASEDPALGRDGAAALAALIETELPGDVDLVERWRDLRRGGAPPAVRDAMREWRRRLAPLPSAEATTAVVSDEGVDVALAAAVTNGYRDRLARRRDTTRSDRRGRDARVFQLVGGGEVVVPVDGAIVGTHGVGGSRWIAVVSLDRGGSRAHAGAAPGRAHLAITVPDAIAMSALADRVELRRSVVWDASRREVAGTEARVAGAVMLSSRPWRDPPADAILAALHEGVRLQGPAGVFDRWPEADELLRRIGFASEPTVGPEQESSSRIGHRDSVGPVASQRVIDDVIGRAAASGRTERASLASTDVAAWIMDSLSWHDRTDLDRYAPTHLAFPSGRRVRIRYPEDGPCVATRLQDLIGVDRHPTVGRVAIPIALELLSPAGRLVQRTSDLPTFWRGSYRDVRSDLRGRYPKHRWPERPWDEGTNP